MMQMHGNSGSRNKVRTGRNVKYSHRVANAFAYYGNRDTVLRKTIRFGGRIRDSRRYECDLSRQSHGASGPLHRTISQSKPLSFSVVTIASFERDGPSSSSLALKVKTILISELRSDEE